MSEKGRRKPIGAKRVSPNGYEYTKTNDGWVLSHRLVAEEKLGRKLRDNERTYFVDGDRKNLDPDNIAVREAENTKEIRIEKLKTRIKALQQELVDLEGNSD